MQVQLVVRGAGDEDILARRLLKDVQDCPQIGGADLVRRPAGPGEKGIVEHLGAIGMTLLSAGGAEFLVGLLKPLVRGPRSQSDDTRSFLFKTPDGHQLEFKGGMSDEEFKAMCDRFIGMVAAGTKDATA